MKNEISKMNKIKEIEKFGRENLYPIILSDSAEVLIKLIRENKPKKILEIGTCIGYSGSLILTNGLDDSILTTIELNENSANIAMNNFKDLGLDTRVDLRIGDAKYILQELDEKYDFIFLDGPKGQYKNYFPYLKNLLKQNGILFADNIYFKGLVLKSEDEFISRGIRTIVKNLRVFIQQIKDDLDFQTDFLEIGDGISISRKIKEKI